MYHYVYKIEFETGHIYIGVRSCECLPEKDPYLGSPYTHKTYWEEYEPNKTIIKVLDTREEANQYEEVLIDWVWSINKEKSLNAHNQGYKFNNFGNKHSEKTRARLSELRKGKPTTAKEFYLVSPTGVEVTGKNLSEFARENNITSSGLSCVITGVYLHFNGWTSSLETHKIYLECYLDRGITKRTLKTTFEVHWVGQDNEGNRKRKSKVLKTIEEARVFRDSIEKEGYSFKINPIGWKKKLKNAEEKQ